MEAAIEDDNDLHAKHTASLSTTSATSTHTKSPPVRATAKPSERTFQSQQQIWNLEQEVVAAFVQVDPDPPLDHSIIPDNPLFHLVPSCNLHDISSFSSKTELYGGVDVSFPIRVNELDGDEDATKFGHVHDHSQEAVAVYVVVDRGTMSVVYRDSVFFVLDVPYIPTYLAFREIAPLEQLIKRQIRCHPEFTPNAVLVDGNGIFHPRHAGIACFVGTRTDLPTIGIAKSLYYEGGWTRDAVNGIVDQFVRQMHAKVLRNPHGLANALRRYRGLIMKRAADDPTTAATIHDGYMTGPPTNYSQSISEDEVGNDKDITASFLRSSPAKKGGSSMNHEWNRKQALQDLDPYCNGLAVPLKRGTTTKASTLDDIEDALRFRILGCALVGHGGRISAAAASHKAGGVTKNPIYVSIGHNISMQKAVQVTASLSMARIPEPIRQADLYGRELMRQRHAAVVAGAAKR